MKSSTIRIATLADLDQIVVLWREMMDFHCELDPKFAMREEAPVNFRKHAAESMADPKHRFFVAEVDGNLAGFCQAALAEYPPVFVLTHYGHIMAITVAEPYRRSGIGHVLLEAALQWFREKKITRVEASIATRNPVSRAFWTKESFNPYMEQLILEL